MNSSDRTTHRTLAARLAIAATVVGATLALASCGDDDAGDGERFCGEIAANKDGLTAPVLEFSDDIEPLLDLYREIGELAPLSIQAEWNQLTSAYETASTVVIDDPESQQEAAAAIYSSEESAAKIETWLRTNCAVEIGPVFTLVPHQP